MAKKKSTITKSMVVSPTKVQPVWQIGMLFPNGQKIAKPRCTLNEIFETYFLNLDKYVGKNITAEEGPTVLAGVTTRGIRMVSGERLLKEADEAVKHAAEDPKCPVVGFRADAVKYRKFLETN